MITISTNNSLMQITATTQYKNFNLLLEFIKKNQHDTRNIKLKFQRTDIEQTIKHRFYVYSITDPQSGIFYIGKGTGQRYKETISLSSITSEKGLHLPKNIKLLEMYNIGIIPIVEILSTNLLEKEALLLEKNITDFYGRKKNGTGPLLNIKSGGGYFGERSKETREKMSKTMKKYYENLSQDKKDDLSLKQQERIKLRSAEKEDERKLKEKETKTKNGTWANNSEKHKEFNNSIEQKTRLIEIGKRNARQINQYDLEDKLIKTWNSISDAAYTLGIGRASISLTCVGFQKVYKGFIWKYTDETIEEELLRQNRINDRNKNIKTIRQYTLEGILIKEWKSFNEISKSIQINRNTISKHCDTNIPLNNYIWKRL